VEQAAEGDGVNNFVGGNIYGATNGDYTHADENP
jgi:hypothetical protein